MKKLRLLLFSAAFSMILGLCSFANDDVFAEPNKMVVIEADFEADDYSDAVRAAFSDPDVETVRVIDINKVKKVM